MKRKIALLSPVFNRLNYTKEGLSLLADLKDHDFFTLNEVYTVIIDDGSTDGTEAWIRENHPDVVIVKGDGNQWWSGSMNLGAKYAFDELGCNFIHLWENDIFTVGDYFGHLHRILDQWDGKTVICSKVFYRVNPKIIFAMGGRFNRKTGEKKLIGRDQEDGEEYSSVREVDWFLGQGICIHKDIFKKVGWFDAKNFPQYHGDIDYALRVQNHGFINKVYPELKLLNDTATTGISHKKDKSLKDLYQSLTSIRSNLNVRKDLKFYRIHATSILAYRAVIRRYYIFFGSFFKWKVFGWFGIEKKGEELY